MPQMMPLNWFILFLLFLLTLKLFSTPNFYTSFNKSSHSFSAMMTTKTLNWKW